MESHSHSTEPVPNEPKRFYAVPGADHNDVAVVGGRAYVQAMDAFLHEVTGK